MYRLTVPRSFALMMCAGYLVATFPCSAQAPFPPPVDYSTPAGTVISTPVDLGLTYPQRQELANAAFALDAAAKSLTRGAHLKAIELANRSFQIRQRILGIEHSETIQAMALLGNLYMGSGNFSEAKAMFQLAFDNSKKIVGLEHQATATYMGKLAEAYQELGQVAEAEKLFRDSLKIKQRLLGPEHWETVYAMHSLGVCLSAQFRPDGNKSHDEAIGLLYQSLEIGQRIQWPVANMVATLQSNIGMAYSTNKEYAKAEPFLRSSVEMLRQAPKAEATDLSSSLNNLGACLYYQRKFEEAETAYLEALPLAEAKFGLDHPVTANCVHNLAALRFAQKRYAEAVPLLQRQHAVFSTLLGPDHLKVKESQQNLNRAIEKLEQSK